MPKSKEGKEFRSIRELSEFRQYWSQSDGYPEENFGNNRMWMPISASYSWAAARKPLLFRSKLHAFVGSGPDDGMVDIDDTAKVKIEDFHLRFYPRYQDYRFDESDHSLVISGSSDKMGGDYNVRCKPTIEAPEDG